jgi:hypothetical protein
MSDRTAEFRQPLIDDYHGALIRLATLRANGRQYLLFAWVELYPYDMNVPDGWDSGVGSMIAHRLRRAGIDSPTHGAHQFRHYVSNSTISSTGVKPLILRQARVIDSI